MWFAPDHVLVIRDHAFREIYARIYWTDMRALLLYSLDRPRGFMLALEIGCLLAVVVSAPLLLNLVWGSAIAAVFVGLYSLWRFTRPNWACEIATRLSAYRFPLRPTIAASRRIVDELKRRAEAAQEAVTEDIGARPDLLASGRRAPMKKQRSLVWHGIAFGLGLLTPLTVILLVVYYVFLVVIYFVQQDFEFPLTIRAAAVMSQILAVLHVVTWLPALRVSGQPEFHLLTVLFSLFGIAAIYQRSLRPSIHEPRGTSVLGLR